MKKPTPDLWLRQARMAKFRARERRKRRSSHRIDPPNRYVRPGKLLHAPKRIDVTLGSGVELGKFLRALEATVLELQIPVTLDFRRTEALYPAGAIRLFAEVDRLVAMSNLPKPITILDPWLKRPREVLKQIGIHEITCDRCDVIPTREDVVYWRATKGRDQSGSTPGEMLEVVAERVNREHAQQLELSGAWRGVSEAVANSVEHAYRKPRADGFVGLANTKWWMFTQLRGDVFTMAVCDLGCGYRATIKETLPEQFVGGIAAAFGFANKDSLAIHAAMEYGRSGTRQTERGKGSRDAMSVIEKHGAGELAILSNTGWMKYFYQSGTGWSSEKDSLGIDIKGTIVWWKLPLKGVEHADD